MTPATAAAAKPLRRHVASVLSIWSVLTCVTSVVFPYSRMSGIPGRQVQELMDLESLEQEIESRDGERPSRDALAKASGLSLFS